MESVHASGASRGKIHGVLAEECEQHGCLFMRVFWYRASIKIEEYVPCTSLRWQSLIVPLGFAFCGHAPEFWLP